MTIRRVSRRARAALPALDRRTRFRDLSQIAASRREARSKVLQVYSAFDNIGNYLPVLGIRDMLHKELDTWNIHDTAIDFEFINRNYKGLIIGGAGLLHATFEGFWRRFVEEIQIPSIAWGIGVCLKDSQRQEPVDSRSVSKAVARQSLRRCDMINLRDPVTAEWYGVGDATITACPTIKHLSPFTTQHASPGPAKRRERLLFASHEALVGAGETKEIRAIVESLDPEFVETDNIQRSDLSIKAIIDSYQDSTAVVTTRLHGAIIAFGLDIPYVAVARDDKVRSFGEKYGGGVVIDQIDELPGSLERATEAPARLDCLAEVETFGVQAGQWMRAL